MKFTKTDINGVYVVEPEPRVDERGYFSRIFCKHELKDVGIKARIVQINRSYTKDTGMIRGMHMQKSPRSEDKIVQCLKGSIFDVAIDMRKNSPTYGKWFGTVISEKNLRMLYVPKNFAHGFQALEPDCIVQYFVSEYYSPGYEVGIRWNDQAIAIKWPLQKAITSEKDASWPDIKI